MPLSVYFWTQRNPPVGCRFAVALPPPTGFKVNYDLVKDLMRERILLLVANLVGAGRLDELDELEGLGLAGGVAVDLA